MAKKKKTENTPKKKSWRPGLVTLLFLTIPLFFAVNWVYHIWDKPSQLVSLFSQSLNRYPEGTWRAHKDSFQKYSTHILTPDYLAALAQTESAGNSLATTYWVWSFPKKSLFELYSPASSAAGVFQITDGTLEEMQRYCIRGHKVSKFCPFNWLTSRLIPSHSIEMTAAYLHANVAKILGEFGKDFINLQAQQDLATVIHLCGVGRARRFVRNDFKASPGEKCGSHSLKRYFGKIHRLQKRFQTIASK